jgi:exosortase
LTLLGLLALLVVLNYSGLRLLMARWDSDSNYGHGYLIPFISAYFVWTKRERLRTVEPVPNFWGLALLLAAIPVRFLAMPLSSAVTAGIGVVVMINGLLLYVGGWKAYRLLWLPMLYLALMVPLPTSVHAAFANPLQTFASWASAGLLDGIFRVPTSRSGNIIKLAGHTLQVAEACSGMRSIMGLLALAVAFAYFWERALWERIFLVASAVPIAVIANICRVTGTGLLYDAGYEKFAQGYYHEFTGWFIFLFAMALFLLETHVLSRLFIYERSRPDVAPDVRTDSPRKYGDGR